MTIDLNEPRGRWLQRLFLELHDRRTGRVGGRKWSRTALGRDGMSNGVRPGLTLLAAYAEGDPPLNDVHRDWKPHIRQYVRMGRLNVGGLLVESTQNRMVLRDFRTSAADDETGDEKARDLMRASQLKIVSRDVHDWLLTFGSAYTLTTPPTKSFDWSRITAEDPRNTITWNDPLTGEVKWGLKVYRGDWDDEDIAYLYGPDGEIWMATLPGATSIRDGVARFNAEKWSWADPKLDQFTPDRRNPLTHFENKRGVGEFEEHLDVLDRINDKIFNEWWTGKIQAFRQRAVKNLPETDEETGEDIDYTDMFRASPDEMWQVPADVDFWESTAVDLGPIIQSIQKDLERLAAVKQQPLHTITPDAANGSAEGASLMREEHLYKIADRIDRVDPRWAATMSRAFAYMKDATRKDAAEYAARSEVTQIEAIWGPTERYSLQQKASAAAQLNGQGGPVLPKEAIWTDVMQYPPAAVADLRTMQGKDRAYDPPAPAGQQQRTTPPAAQPDPVPATR